METKTVDCNNAAIILLKTYALMYYMSKYIFINELYNKHIKNIYKWTISYVLPKTHKKLSIVKHNCINCGIFNFHVEQQYFNIFCFWLNNS